MNQQENQREILLDFERKILHTAMMRPSSISDMPLQGSHFASESHGALWELVRYMDASGKPVEPITVADEASRNRDTRLSQLAYEIGCAPDLYPSSNPAYQAGVIIEAWQSREAMDIAKQLARGSQDRQEGAVDQAISRLMALNTVDSTYEHTAESSLKAALEQAIQAKGRGGRIVGVSTGLQELDDALGGYHPSDLIVVGARPAMGKTGFLLGATSAGAKGGSVGLISGEQPAEQVGLRWLAAGSGVNVGKLRAGKFDDSDMSELLHAADIYGKLPIKILDRPSPDISEICREARKWKHQHDMRALYVDYIQRIEAKHMGRAKRNEVVGYVCKTLKNLARELKIPVISLAQVSREADNNKSGRPQMGQLADSSEIEKEADQIIMLWRDLSTPHAARSAAELNIVKNRHGNIGTVYVTWHGGSTSFVNRSPQDEFGD